MDSLQEATGRSWDRGSRPGAGVRAESIARSRASWVFVHVLITLNLNFLICKTEIMTSSLEGVLNETIVVMMIIVA